MEFSNGLNFPAQTYVVFQWKSNGCLIGVYDPLQRKKATQGGVILYMTRSRSNQLLLVQYWPCPGVFHWRRKSVLYHFPISMERSLPVPHPVGLDYGRHMSVKQLNIATFLECLLSCRTTAMTAQAACAAHRRQLTRDLLHFLFKTICKKFKTCINHESVEVSTLAGGGAL